MPTVHMIHGFVGAGKTTFSRKLEQDLRAVRFSPDEWMCDLYGTNPPADTFAQSADHIEKLIRKVAGTVLAAGVDVILDEGFWTKSGRDKTRLWAQALGADVKLYILTCPDDVMTERALKRTAELPYGALVIDAHALREFRTRFEPVDPMIEPGIVITTG